MKLGVVLGSGSARGWAHIGILNQLSRLGIKPDIVTGSSIGALVGAAVANHRLEELEGWVRSLDNWQVLGLLDWGLGRGGLISGEKVFEKVTDTIGTLEFSDLHMPFGAVTTDLLTGREVWLTEGKVKDALRCSCAIPGILAPAKYEGRWMVDGATVNPIPVSLCRALGADFVIAIDLNSEKSYAQAKLEEAKAVQAELESHSAEAIPLPEEQIQDIENIEKNGFEKLISHSVEYMKQLKEKPKTNKVKTPDLFAVMSGCIDIMQDRITRSKLAGDPPDLVLQPKLAKYGIMEFDRADELIKEGEKCVEASQSVIEYQLEHYIALTKRDP